MSLRCFVIGFLLMFLSTAINAQDCVPDQSIKEIGFTPKNIEIAIAGASYKHVIQIRVFKDTTVVVGGNPTLATIDSIKVNDILGLPTGFYYTCSRKNCSYIPDSTGCAALMGNPGTSEVGIYPLGIAIEVFAKVFGGIPTSQKDTLGQYTLEVSDGVSVPSIYNNQITAVYPNPSNGVLTLNPLLINQLESISVRNTLGQEIAFEQIDQDIRLSDSFRGMCWVEVTLFGGQVLRNSVFIME